MKIYCSKCKYYKWYNDDYGTEYCKHSSNVFFRRNYRYSWTSYRYAPDILNEDNNCKNFEYCLLWKIINFFNIKRRWYKRNWKKLYRLTRKYIKNNIKIEEKISTCEMSTELGWMMRRIGMKKVEKLIKFCTDEKIREYNKNNG